MKKMLLQVVSVMFMIGLFSVGIAEGVAMTGEVLQEEAFTWQYLASIAGATAATLLIVQFLKAPLDKMWKIPTRLFVYVISLTIMLIATGFTEGLCAENTLLAAVNAFIVALSAYGAYEVTFAKLDHAE